MWILMKDNFEMDSNFCDVMCETLEVLKKVEGDFFEKLPEQIKRCLEEYSKKSTKKVYLDTAKSLNEQEISDECKDLVSVIYYMSCKNETEKRGLLECWNDNMKR